MIRTLLIVWQWVEGPSPELSLHLYGRLEPALSEEIVKQLPGLSFALGNTLPPCFSITDRTMKSRDQSP
jgi:hypothetical protein